MIRVLELMENSPATEAGIEVGDVIAAVNGRPANELTLSAINELLELPVPCELTIERGPEVIKTTLTPRRII